MELRRALWYTTRRVVVIFQFSGWISIGDEEKKGAVQHIDDPMRK